MSFLSNAGAQLAISACGFRYVIQGLLRAGLKGFYSSEPRNFVGSAEPMEPTLTGPLQCAESECLNSRLLIRQDCVVQV